MCKNPSVLHCMAEVKEALRQQEEGLTTEVECLLYIAQMIDSRGPALKAEMESQQEYVDAKIAADRL